MKLKDIGDIGNLVAAFGVIASLLIVAYQINQNTQESRAANRQAVADSIRELTLTYAVSPTLASAIETVNQGKELAPTQYRQYRGFLIALFKSIEEAYLQYKDGRLDEETMKGRLSTAMFYLRYDIGYSVYQSGAKTGFYNTEFITWLDSQLEERLEEYIDLRNEIDRSKP